MFTNPHHAYKAGFALVDNSVASTDLSTFRYVTEHGAGTIFTVPIGAVEMEVLVRSAGHGDIYGAPLDEVVAAATEKKPLQ